MSGNDILSVTDLKKHFTLGSAFFGGRKTVKAVDGVSFSMARGEVLGLVGESGSGKSTVGRTILRLSAPTSGSITFDGQDITSLGRSQLRPIRRKMQMVFQDPFSSLNPRMTVEDLLTTPLKIHRLSTGPGAREKRVAELLELVGLSPAHASRFPHEFSGGQRQRIGIARALAVQPDLLVADEPVSALDVSIQAQVVKLLLEIRQRLGCRSSSSRMTSPSSAISATASRSCIWAASSRSRPPPNSSAAPAIPTARRSSRRHPWRTPR